MDEEPQLIKISPLQYVNTGLLALIFSVVTFIFMRVDKIETKIDNIQIAQSVQAGEIQVLQTEKENNKTNIRTLFNNDEMMKTWIDATYKRKDQK